MCIFSNNMAADNTTEQLVNKIKYAFILELSVMQYRTLLVSLKYINDSHTDLDPF